MADIFSGLERFGLKGIKEEDIYKQKRTVNADKDTSSKQKPKMREKDYLFGKSYTCPLCENKFKEKVVRVAYKRVIRHDEDLRPIYDGIDANKYDVVMCMNCGYTSLADSFGILTPMMYKLIRTQICSNYKRNDIYGEIYTYDDAIERYKMALANSIIKRSKASERAYICLKISWLYRGKGEMLDEGLPNYEETLAECRSMDLEFGKKAYEGFVASLAAETFPIAGMDEYTLSLIMAVLGRKCGDYNNAMRLLGRIILAPNIRQSIKELARSEKARLDKCMADADC